MEWKWIKELFITEEPKHCVDCDHCDKSTLKCNSPQNKKAHNIDIVTGKIIEGSDVRYEDCRAARRWGLYDSDRCGPKGYWFESKRK